MTHIVRALERTLAARAQDTIDRLWRIVGFRQSVTSLAIVFATSLVSPGAAQTITQIIDTSGDGAGNALNTPLGIAVDDARNVYVAGSSSNNAFKIAPGGVISQIIDAAGDGGGNTLSGSGLIAVDASGNVYLAGRFSDNAFKITPGGVITEIIDGTGDGAGHVLDFPAGIAVDASNNVYVTGANSDNAFKIATPGTCSTNGTPCVITEIIDASGDGAGNTLLEPEGIALDASNNVYVTGVSSENVFKIATPGPCSTNGTPCVISEIIDATGDGGGNTLSGPALITADASDNVYVAGVFSHNAFKITPGGLIAQIIDMTGDGAGNALDDPEGIAVDTVGNVYVTGAGTNNAFKIDLKTYVDASATGANDGTTWADAYNSLQDALADAAVTPREIWVAEGTYMPDGGYKPTGGSHVPGTGDRTSTFQLLNGVALYGGFAGGETSLDERDIDASETILSGDLDGDDADHACPGGDANCASNGGLCVDGFCIIADDNAENSYHVVTGSFTDATAVLDGFKIIGGNADGSIPDDRGAGTYVDTGSPRIASCTLSSNSAAFFGGGMYNSNNSSPTVTNCAFSGNSGGASAAGGGGGMYNGPNSNPTLTNCTFTYNSAVVNGGGMVNGNGSSPVVTDCVFANNKAGEPTGSGGGMENFDDSNPLVQNSVFMRNTAHNGGAMANSESAPMITNCILAHNNVSLNGGGMYNYNNSNPIVVNCTFADNQANGRGGGINNALDGVNSPVVQNTILWENSDDADGNAGGPFTDESAQIYTESGNPVLSYCIVMDDDPNDALIYPGTGNVDDNPLFVDADGADNIAGTEDDDLRLRVGSPAIDAGDTTALPADVADLDDDADTGERIPWDLAGKLRVIDDPSSSDTGVGPEECVGGVRHTWQCCPSGNCLDGMCVGGSRDGLVCCPGGSCQLYPGPIADMGAYEFQPLIFVDASATGANDGESWADAYNNLDEALSTAGVLLRDIWVANGTYMPDGGYKPTGGSHVPGSGDRTATFQLVSGVAVYGGFAGGETSLNERDIEANETILSGDLDGDDMPHACPGGDADCASNGKLCVDVICIIADNNAENSYHVVTGSGTDATAILDGFTITAGNANGTDPLGYGGGCYVNAGSPQLNRCIIRNNLAADAGGGIYSIVGSPSFLASTFSGNVASSGISNGGGLLISDGSASSVVSCRFFKNSAAFGGGVATGLNGIPTFANCVFSGNLATQKGGGLDNTLSNAPTIASCVFFDNHANQNGGGLRNATGSTPTISNSIFWFNSDSGGAAEFAQIHSDGGTPMVTYSVIMDDDPDDAMIYPGTGNIDDDPLFVNADGADNIPGTEDDNLRLQPGSPAIDAGDTTALPLDTLDLDGDGDTSERIPWDLVGNPRVIDDLLTTDTGVAGSPVVDMGAYEFFRDCDNSGVADSEEITLGTSPDCNGNGIPDSCDIDACTPLSADYPLCDDCNLNGVPDGCEVPSSTGCPGGLCVSGCSTDGNEDCVPDKCETFTAGCDPNIDWSCGANWDLGGQYPDDNASASGVFVTLSGTDNVFLDVNATIPSLRILDSATLLVTQTGAAGNLTINTSAGLFLRGGFGTVASILIGEGRVIDVSAGPVVIGRGGLYQAFAPPLGVTASGSDEPFAGVAAASTLLADSLTIREGSASDGVAPGTMLLTGQMQAVTARYLLLDDSGSDTPPILSVSGASSLSVGGDMALLGPTTLQVDSTDATVTLRGNLDNQSTDPSIFDWSAGSLILDGGRTIVDPQKFEVAGVDLGEPPLGFTNNFAIDTLVIGTAGQPTTVRFVNEFGNTAGAGSCREALYVNHLIIEAGSTVILDGVRLYYNELKNLGGTIQDLGCGEATRACIVSNQPKLATLQTPSGTPTYTTNRYLPVRIQDNDGVGRLIRVEAVQLPPPFQGTAFEGQQWWAGQPFRVCEKSDETGGTGCSAIPGQPKGRRFNWYAPLVCDQSQAVPIQIGTCQGGVCSGGFAAGDSCARDDDCQVLYLEHEGIVPSLSNRAAIYEVRVIGEDCGKIDPNNYSDPLTITQARLGDLANLGSECETPAGGNGPGGEDINAILKKFGNGFCQVKKARCDITRIGGGPPDHRCDSVDIIAVLAGFANPTTLPWGPVNPGDPCQ